MNLFNRNSASQAASSAEAAQQAADAKRTQAELADVPTADQVSGAEIQSYADRGINLGTPGMGTPGTPGTPGRAAVYSTGGPSPFAREDLGVGVIGAPDTTPAGTLISPAVAGTPGTPGTPQGTGINSPAVQYALQRRQNLINKIQAGGDVTQARYNYASADRNLAAASAGGDPLSIIAGLFGGGGAATGGGAGLPITPYAPQPGIQYAYNDPNYYAV